jgi:hypothetical protein
MDRKHPDYEVFKKEFWQWFDALPRNKKEMFWRYKEDMAEMNFYFTVYSKKQLTKHENGVN